MIQCNRGSQCKTYALENSQQFYYQQLDASVGYGALKQKPRFGSLNSNGSGRKSEGGKGSGRR